MEFNSKDHFLTLVAKDAVVRQYGGSTKDWPRETFWTVVSSVKCNITDAEVPKLMAAYKVKSLPDFHHGVIPS